MKTEREIEWEKENREVERDKQNKTDRKSKTERFCQAKRGKREVDTKRDSVGDSEKHCNGETITHRNKDWEIRELMWVNRDIWGMTEREQRQRNTFPQEWLHQWSSKVGKNTLAHVKMFL